MVVVKSGTWRENVKTNQGLKQITLQDVDYVPELMCNLFSLTKAMDNGWEVHGADKKIVLKKDGVEIPFTNNVSTQSGYVCDVIIEPKCELALVT